MKKQLAVVTMVHNEGVMLKRWVAHYKKHVNELNDLVVIDHSSTDDSVDAFCGGLNIVRVERDPSMVAFNEWRANLVSDLVDKLLAEYEYVIYVDSDEMLVVNPSVAASLVEYTKITDAKRVSSYAIGFDVLQKENERDLEDYLVSEVRSKVQLVFAMCKPVLVSEQGVSWSPGFHTSNIKPIFGDLYLFHLRYADRKQALSKLARTRTYERPEAKAAACDHQKISDEVFDSWVRSWLSFPTCEESILADNSELMQKVRNIEFSRSEISGIYSFDYSYRSNQLYIIPNDLKGSF